MKQRIITGLLLVALLAALLWAPGWFVALVMLICVGFATWEEYHALGLAGHRAVSWPAWVVLGGSVPLTLAFGASMIVPLMAIALLIMAVQILWREKPDLIDLAISVMPILTVVLPGLCLVAISLTGQKAVEVVLLCLVFAVPLLGDTMALFIGSAVGGKKLCPAVSPHKTVAGAIAGLGGSLLAAMIICGIAQIACNAETLAKLPSWWIYLILGLAGGCVGQVGDLFASLVKRHSGIKDFSNLFPGHGGMLDRLDSVLFMAVLVFCYRTFMI
ncbi:MAG: phosphatidate cytidylyltransferase [Clostridia bacterium]|nr:phosphatidate cytidylyltransferase [Clostridia bacterium]